ncbi:speedy protein E4-like [Rhynchonycteris naso]
MASREPSFQSEKQSPQPRSLGYPLEVRVVEVVPGPSEEEREESAPGAQDIWIVDTLCGLKMKLKKHRRSSVLPEHHKAFTRLLEDPVIKKFLAWDKNLMISDKYLLSMVVAYFSRAGLYSWQYQRIHFFLALYLALDMEENYHAPKQVILPFLYGEHYCTQRPSFHKLRFQFFRSMGCRAWVSREECEEIQAFDPDLWVWGRDRTLISKATEAKVGLKEGGLCAHGYRRNDLLSTSLSPGEIRVFSTMTIQMLMADTRTGKRSLLGR